MIISFISSQLIHTLKMFVKNTKAGEFSCNDVDVTTTSIILKQISSSDMYITWDSFKDVEEFQTISHSSGIQSYMLGIGIHFFRMSSLHKAFASFLICVCCLCKTSQSYYLIHEDFNLYTLRCVPLYFDMQKEDNIFKQI